MSIKVPPPNTDGDFPKLPDGEAFRARVVSVDIIQGKDTDKFKNKDGTPKDRIEVILEATADEYMGARVWARCAMSWHPKAGNGSTGIRQIVQAASPRDLSDDELYQFDLEDLVGRELAVIGTLNEDGYLRPMLYKRVKATAKTAPKPAAVEDEEIDV